MSEAAVDKSVPEAGTAPEQEEIVSKDAEVRASDDKTKMLMSLYVEPPVGDGAPVTIEDLQAFLKKKGVVYGVMDDALERIAQEQIYGQWIEVAHGLPAKDGIDGRLNELFPHEIKPVFKEREDGTVNYKEMDIVINVEEGQTICEVALPVPPEDGRNIYGTVLHGRTGLAAVVPAGENTSVSADGTLLTAAKAGSLIYRKGKYCIDPILKVENVDTAMGNIRFNGDVVVRGIVQEGFEIHSKGNVRIQGQVEGASIYADGNILLDSGINGMNHGILQAGGDITAKYIENCKVTAGGNIKTEGIVNATVETDGNIEIAGKRGRIAGGKLTVFGSIKTRRVGSKSAVHTTIILGTTPTIMKEKTELSTALKGLTEEFAKMQKDLAYLESLDKKGQINNPERKQALNQLRLKVPVLKMKLEKQRKALTEMEERIMDVGNCVLTSEKVYPPTKIQIGSASLITQKIYENVRIYRDSKGEIKIGTL